MKVKEHVTEGNCEWCPDEDIDLNVVVFEHATDPLLLCPDCLLAIRKVFEILDVKEADA